MNSHSYVHVCEFASAASCIAIKLTLEQTDIRFAGIKLASVSSYICKLLVVSQSWLYAHNYL